jgi:hypothetical protein
MDANLFPYLKQIPISKAKINGSIVYFFEARLIARAVSAFNLSRMMGNWKEITSQDST